MSTKTLICFYSRSGTARLVADELRAVTGWPVAEVADVVPRTGSWGDLRCMFDARTGRARFAFDGPPPDRFDDVVVLAPVWLGHLAAPMRSFLRRTPLGDARVSLISVSSADDGRRAAREAAGAARRPVKTAMGLLQQEVTSGLSPELLEDFARGVERREYYDRTRERPQWLSPETA